MLSPSWLWGMDSLFDPITHLAIGCMPFESPWASLDLALIDCWLRLTIRLTDQTWSTRYAIYERLRLRSTSSSIARFSMSLKDGSTVFSERYRCFPAFLGTLSRDAWPYTYKRPSMIGLVSSNHMYILDQLSPNISLPFLWCSWQGVPSGKGIEMILD
jgi:hypothetical protein